MVERTKAEGFDEFTGTVESVSVEETEMDKEKKTQIHISIKPVDVEIGGKTGLMHEWVGLSAKSTETSVPEGSVADKYLQQLEILDNDFKVEKVVDAFKKLEGRTFLFKKIRHGKSFSGHEAKGYWTPVKEEKENE